MKILFRLIFLFFLTTNYSQKILIEGIALDSTNGRNQVIVIKNDIINKLLSKKKFKMKKYDRVWKKENHIVKTDSLGKFKIVVRIDDSLTFESFRHISKKIAVRELIKSDKIKIKLEPEICEVYKPCIDSFPGHYVFVGKKIKLEYAKRKYYCNVISFDSKFDAEYKVIKSIYGKLDEDIIKFTVYDHNGRPQFGNFDTVMLFISNYCNEFFHQKYQYYDLYKTKDGRYASPYKTFEYSRLDSTSLIKPELIEFEKKVFYKIKNASKEHILKNYPEPYYKIKRNKVIAIYGNYVPELLELKKQTILKERNIILD